ncbi:MAG: hypothetical protein HOH43_16265 [Candidatus Latescibacteria bacterium]|nr:hypothetical protein [Candidatus Latescibacterota bacterium]
MNRELESIHGNPLTIRELYGHNAKSLIACNETVVRETDYLNLGTD